MNFEVEISYKANLDIRHIYEYYVMNNFDLNYVRHLINGIVSLIKSLEYLPERYPRFELLKKETNVRYAIYKKYKIIYEIMDDKVYILRVIHHSQNITNNYFLAENEIPYVVESDYEIVEQAKKTVCSFKLSKRFENEMILVYEYVKMKP